jgi:hypothetical protein
VGSRGDRLLNVDQTAAKLLTSVGSKQESLHVSSAKTDMWPLDEPVEINIVKF